MDEETERQLAEFDTRSAERKTQLENLNGLLESAKTDLEANLTEIERLEGELNSDPGNSTLEGELQTARDATEGLRDAKNTAQENVNPILFSQGMDDYYLQKGLEFVSYTNLKTAEEGLERSRGQLEEAKADLPDAEEHFSNAQYELELAKMTNNREEYEYARGLFDEAEARLNDLRRKESEASEEVQRLEMEMPDIEQEFKDAKKNREDQAQFIKDAADVDVEPYDPAEGPPAPPEEADAAGEGSSGDAPAE